jgi:hypothetical protein
MNGEKPILLGNTFSLALVRRKVIIEPISLELMRRGLLDRGFVSYWGHAATIGEASRLLGVDVTPPRELGERPSITLSSEGLPTLGGQIFTDCYILGPLIERRPKIGEEIFLDEIMGWNPLKMIWPDGS